MKLISLNIWGAIVRDPFIEFIKQHKDTDIFCFQEVYDNSFKKLSSDQKDGTSGNIFSELKELLPNHQAFFRPVIKDEYGIAAFVKSDITVVAEGEIKIHLNTKHLEQTGHHDRNMQWLEVSRDQKIYSILNVHGLWNGMGKTDTEDRLLQSQKIRAFMDTIRTPKILCGDFNLKPDTESVKILEKGMKNLVSEYNVESTRTSFYTKPEKFADYIFTSLEIAINRFEVMKDEVSDHAALLLDFN